MTFLLPVVATISLLGYTFDLRRYTFKYYTVYDKLDIKSYTQITDIYDYRAEYKLIESEVDYRKFLGVDVVTNLKILVDDYDYSFGHQLKSGVDNPSSGTVQLALKLSLRTVKETVPVEAPQVSDWGEVKEGWNIGTHYIKSIIYGTHVLLLMDIFSRSPENKAEIKESILSKLGRSGTLDQSFKEKFDEILEEQNTFYTMSFSGVVPLTAPNIPATTVDRMLALKETLPEAMKTVNDGKGAVCFYEMEPLSSLNSSFPRIEISSNIVNQLDEIERKYEDLRVANEELYKWFYDRPVLTEEEELKVAAFQEELEYANLNMTLAISGMDISTLGNVSQFSKALQAYGDTDDDHKYRRAVELLRQQGSD